MEEQIGYTLADIAKRRKERPVVSRWGPWLFKKSNLTLEHTGNYYIDLERCCNSAEVLDWIAQVAGKAWITPEALGYLVLALDDLLNLQVNLCSCGRNLKCDPSSFLPNRPTA